MKSNFYDFLQVNCPICNFSIEAEIKGDCSFEKYDLSKPVCISDAQKLVGNVITCPECERKFQIIGDIPSFKIHLYLEEIK